MILDAINRKLERKLKKLFISEGYDSAELEDGSVYHIKSENIKSQKCVDIYIYAELDMDTFFDRVDDLNEVVMQYDPGAYFDVVEPGVFMARLYWDTLNKYKDTSEEILTPKNLTKLGESICLELEDTYDEEFYIDDIKYNKTDQRIEIEVSSNTFASQTNLRVHEYELESYSDLREVAFDKLVRNLNSDITRFNKLFYNIFHDTKSREGAVYACNSSKIRTDRFRKVLSRRQCP